MTKGREGYPGSGIRQSVFSRIQGLLLGVCLLLWGRPVLAQAWDVLCHPVDGMGYQIICPRCSRLYGEGKDGVKAENSPVAGTLKIECGCTVHLYQTR